MLGTNERLTLKESTLEQQETQQHFDSRLEKRIQYGPCRHVPTTRHETDRGKL